RSFMRLLILLYFLILTNILYCQNNQWLNFFATRPVYSIASEGNYIWAGTSNGIIKLNKLTGQKEFIRKYFSGLPSNNVGPISIDSQGNKWIGTDSGLVKYDNKNWIIYNSNNSILETHRFNFFISAIAIDLQGNKWIGTKDGEIIKYDGVNWTLVKQLNKDNIPDTVLTRISIDYNGNIWIGTDSDELIKYDGNNWVTYNSKNLGFPFWGIWAITPDLQGRVWFGTSNGIAVYDGQIWTTYPQIANMSYCVVQSLAIDSQGNKWMGVERKGLIKFDGQTWTVYNKSNSGFRENSAQCITIDEQGNKWMGTYQDSTNDVSYTIISGSIVKYDDKDWTIYNDSNSGLTTDDISSVAVDSLGNKWFVTPSGLVKYDGNSWTTYTSSNIPVLDNNILFVTIDPQGNKWVKTQNHLLKYDDQKWTLYKVSMTNLPEDIEYFNDVTSIAFEKSGKIWMGTCGYGLLKYDNTGWTVYSTDSSGLPDDYISCVKTDQLGNVWIIGIFSNMLIKFDGKTWTKYPPPADFRMTSSSTCAIDTKGNVWIGSTPGLLKFDGANWTTYTKANSGIPNDYIEYIAFDKSDNLWICSFGLEKFDGTNWTAYNTFNSGISDNYLSSIAFDPQGNKWIGTHNGLSVFKEDGINFTGVKENSAMLPSEPSLKQNYPNPFNPSTKIEFTIKNPAHVSLKIYDLLGKEVATLLNEYKEAGEYRVQFNASSLPSGIYIYRITAGEYKASRKLMLLK
ncbi:MAG: T9SS type A sorting domain-containing protein, partial [Clostridiales bacterium]